MTESIRLLVVDDHKFFRNALLKPLHDDPNYEIVADAPNGLMALEMVAQFQPDIVIMDLHMPQMDGIQASQQLIHGQEKGKHKLGIVVVTGDKSPETAVKAFRIGVRGYLIKESITNETLRCAIQAVYYQGFYCEPDLFIEVLGYLSQRDLPQMAENLHWQKKLKPKEFQLILDVARGKTNAAIAMENQVSSKTISNRLSTLYNILNVSNQVELVTYSLRNRIIKLEDI